MKCCCRPPSYVRAIKLENKTDEEVTATVTFKSEVTESYTLAVNEEKEIERGIDQGTYTTVDPVISLDVKSGDLQKIMTFNPTGVQVLHYHILKESNGLTFELK